MGLLYLLPPLTSPVGARDVGLTPPPPPPSSAQVLERVELYLYSTQGPSWPIKRVKTYLPSLQNSRDAFPINILYTFLLSINSLPNHTVLIMFSI